MFQHELMVPTYNGNRFPEAVEIGEIEEYGEPSVPVLICEEAGLRLFLGTHDSEAQGVPELLIERQPIGWVIFLHPESGGDPCGYLYVMDDGKVFLSKEYPYGTPEIEVLEPREKLPEIYGPVKKGDFESPPPVVDCAPDAVLVNSGPNQEADLPRQIGS